MRKVDIVVIGGGAMGLATAWRAAGRGRTVLLAEQFDIATPNGASHGACRNFNPHYATQPHLDLVREAADAFDELAEATGRILLDRCGLVSHGPGQTFRDVYDRMGEAGLEREWLSLAEAERRFTGMRFDTQVLYTPSAGRVRSEETLHALMEAAVGFGADLRFGTRAESIELDDDGGTVTLENVRTGEQEVVRAAVVVSAAGAWTTKLISGLVALPPLRVTQESPVHFPDFDVDATWPSFNHRPEPGDSRYGDYWKATVYGMHTPGEGIKAGWHRVGPETDPDKRTFLPDASSLASLREYAREWLPGVNADEIEPISCTYTTAPDSLFVCDRVGPLVVLAGFAGEGFKFVPSIGRLGADLADGLPGLPAFALDRDFGERDRSGLATVLG
ncbi:FAD-dependent oxidoreductase [Gulosibacter macacae]|uniref:FAD-dependent oxidoreductase n=1 Tax=Gulosibacter macacae TaxID=2488791 RepID=A0A3P3VY96_9MICO|nr:FAD-dependent oxidoreductase [Gulosibacter macacae]RRJ86576.1 FAD-dependent oxidoreductase [Gulosibacter macacae]